MNQSPNLENINSLFQKLLKKQQAPYKSQNIDDRDAKNLIDHYQNRIVQQGGLGINTSPINLDYSAFKTVFESGTVRTCHFWSIVHNNSLAYLLQLKNTSIDDYSFSLNDQFYYINSEGISNANIGSDSEFNDTIGTYTAIQSEIKNILQTTEDNTTTMSFSKDQMDVYFIQAELYLALLGLTTDNIEHLKFSAALLDAELVTEIAYQAYCEVNQNKTSFISSLCMSDGSELYYCDIAQLWP